jgi:hypothetical protein
MDERDDPVDIAALFARYPQLKSIFQGEARHHNALTFLITQTDVEQKYDVLMNHVTEMMYNAGISVKNDMLIEYAEILKTNKLVFNKFNYMFSNQDKKYNKIIKNLSMAYLGNFISLSSSAMTEESEELQEFLTDESHLLQDIISFVASKSGGNSQDVEEDAPYIVIASLYSSIKQQLPKIIKAVWPNL